MKKFLAIVAIASLAVACNSNADKKDNKDTTVTVTPGGDTVTKVTDIDTTDKGGGDTTINKTVDTDTTKKDKM